MPGPLSCVSVPEAGLTGKWYSLVLDILFSLESL
jgi:hypothetical protein